MVYGSEEHTSYIAGIKKEIQKLVKEIKNYQQTSAVYNRIATQITKLSEDLVFSDCAAFNEYYTFKFIEKSSGNKLFSTPLIHKQIYILFENNDLVSVMIPREHGKTTVAAYFYPIWRICTGRSKFALIICSNSSSAIQRIDTIKETFEHNDIMQARFGHFGKKEINCRKWTDEITDFNLYPLKSDTPNRIIVMPAGAEEQLKGKNIGTIRPDLIILDDVFASTDLQRSKERKEKAISWLYDAVMPLGDRAKIINIGTIGSYDDPQIKLSESGVWSSFIFGACNRKGEPFLPVPENPEDQPENWIFPDDGSEMLWPEARDKTWLYKKYLIYKNSNTIGEFLMNFMNQVQDKRNAMFPRKKQSGEDMEIYYNETPEELRALKKLDVYMTIDPASSQREKADRRVIMIIGVDVNTDTWYILEYHASREDTQAFFRKFEILHNKWNPRFVGIEANSMQELFYDNIVAYAMDRGIIMRHKKLNPGNAKDGKHIRIEDALSRRYNSGHLLFSKKHDLLLNEMWNFVKFRNSGHDDLVDALSYMASIVQKQKIPKIHNTRLRIIDRPLLWK